MVLDVTKSKTGTIAEDKGPAKVSPFAEVKTPEPASKVSPDEPPKLYSQLEADALVRTATKQAAESEAGREKAKSEAQITSLKDQIADVTAEREKIQEEIEGLTKEDSAKFDLVKKDKDLRERERTLKASTVALEAEKVAHAETVTLAQGTLREIAIWDIATEFQGGDPVKLKDLCDTFEAKTEESIRKVAETIWAKGVPVAKDPEKKALKVYSGITEGGAEDLSGLSPRQKIQRGLEAQARNKT